MISLISKIAVKFKPCILLAFKWWVWWSNFYQKIELKYMNTKPGLLKKFQNDPDAIDLNGRRSPALGWKNYCKDNGLYHYKRDKWYMLWDVISHPARFLARQGGDCDDFSRLAYDYFGERMLTADGISYYFLGLVSVIWKNGLGHSVAIWENPNREHDFIMVSNSDLTRVKNYIEFWDYRHGGVVWVGYFGVDNDKITFRKIKST